MKNMDCTILCLLAVALIKMKRKGLIKTNVIGYPVIPIVIILFSFALVINTIIVQPKQSAIGLLLVLTGVPFYYYFRKNKPGPLSPERGRAHPAN